MTPEEIENHINNGTFFDALIKDVRLDTKTAGDGKHQLTIRFPEWYTTHISDDSKNQIEALIRENAQRFFSE